MIGDFGEFLTSDVIIDVAERIEDGFPLILSMSIRMIGIVARCGLILVALSFALPRSHGAIVIQGFDPNKHNRFNNSPEFIGNPFSWAGVGLSNTGTWGTLISPSYVVSAFHSPPTGLMRFYQTNDPNGPFIERNVLPGVQIAGSDMILSRLASPVTGIAPIGVASFQALADANGQTMFTIGLSNGPATSQNNQRFGRNTIDGIIPNFSDPNLGATVGNVIVFDYDNPGGVGADESHVQGGDSGGPSIIVSNGQLALVGIHWFQYMAGELPGSRPGSGDTFVSSYINQLNAAMVGESLTLVSVQAVPEPSSLLAVVLVLGGYSLAIRRRASQTRRI